MRDPLLRRVRRFATVAARVGLLPELPRSVPALLRTLAEGGLSVRTVHALHARDAGDRPAITDERRSLTYREADQEMNRLANSLAGLGVGHRTPVLIAMENRAEYVLAWFALLRLGARVIHASYRLTPPELAYLVEHSGASLAIVGEEAAVTARAVQRDHPLRLVCVGPSPSGPDHLRYERLIRDAVSTRMPDPGARGAGGAAESVVYTSGTTGKPKGASRDLDRVGVLELSRLLERLPLHLFDRHLVCTPLYHSGAQAMTMLATSLAGEVRLATFDPPATLATLRDERISATFLVPTMLRRLLDHPVPALPELRAVLSGAAEFPHELRLRAIRAFGAGRVFDFYGATELGWVTLCDGHEMQARPGTVGRALAGQEIGIVGPDGGRVPVGETGLVCVRNDQGMEGYLRDDAATQDSRRDGYLTVDDLGRLDADGYLYLSGRARDMVKSGGVNLYPVEIEEALLGHPSVREIAVVGVPDPEWGEALVAVVVPAGGSVDPAELEAFARTRLSGPKVPRRWEVVAELPRNALGKVLKGALRARYTPA